MWDESSSPDGAPVLVWNTSMVISNSSQQIEYGGKPLLSDTAYSWQVRWWNAVHAASPLSERATFTTGLLAPGDWMGAQWIGVTAASPGNQLRRSFSLPQGARIVRATAYVVGLGYYKLWLDGERASDHELGIFTTFAKRVMYHAWDVTSILTDHGSGEGDHAIAVALGHGWYSQPTVAVGPRSLRLRLSITYQAAGATTSSAFNVVTSASDGQWKQHAGPVVMDDIYAGET